jgi:hypothetical protein
MEGKLSSLPALANWRASDHEFQRASDVMNAARDDDPGACLAALVDVLLSMGTRHAFPQPYLDAAIPPDYLSYYPLNLVTFQSRLESDWAEMTVGEWLGDLAASWGIEAHLRIALRKLNGESKDTFLVYPTDEGMKRREDSDPPRPGFTASRVDRAVRFMVDLGLARWDMDERNGQASEDSEELLTGWVARITPLGREVLEALRG